MFLCLSLWQVFSARVSFCVRVSVFALIVVGGGVGWTLPWPLKVALEGAPKIGGCGTGARRHASAVVQAGGVTGALVHGEVVLHACAS